MVQPPWVFAHPGVHWYRFECVSLKRKQNENKKRWHWSRHPPCTTRCALDCAFVSYALYFVWCSLSVGVPRTTRCARGDLRSVGECLLCCVLCTIVVVVVAAASAAVVVVVLVCLKRESIQGMIGPHTKRATFYPLTTQTLTRGHQKDRYEAKP